MRGCDVHPTITVLQDREKGENSNANVSTGAVTVDGGETTVIDDGA